MLKVGITGNIASGKSIVEKFLKTKGYKVLDADAVSHNLLQDNEIKAKVCETFKKFNILENDKICRKKLGEIVFPNEKYRKELEKIIHPLVKKEIERFFHFHKHEKIAFVSIPLLFEAKFGNLFDKIILVYADDKIRIDRLIKRNNLTIEHAQNRLKIQMGQDEKIKLSDFVIYNNKTLDSLAQETDESIKYLLYSR